VGVSESEKPGPGGSAPAIRTVKDLLAATRPWLEKKGVASARLDAELLVAHALGMKRLDLYLDLDRPLTDEEIARCRALVVRRGAREPVAHILGEREFWGLPFTVTKDVLVPRPETEHLVEAALARVPAEASGLFVDACTGSGCVAIAILKERPGLRAIATDLSPAALAVARENAARLGVADRLELLEGDLLEPVLERVEELLFVVANPPYIRADERAALAPEVGAHEPAVALFGEGADGLGHHRRILARAGLLLPPGRGFVALEIGAGQGDACRAFDVPGFGAPAIEKDLGGLDRVCVFARAP
jgi:release factor glutamine methyltransferase